VSVFKPALRAVILILLKKRDGYSGNAQAAGDGRPVNTRQPGAVEDRPGSTQGV
jgi:hypothetical protein